MRALTASLMAALAASTAAAGQQQGSIQLSTETQLIQGDRPRKGTESGFEPDFGVSLLQPGSQFGQLQMEVRGTRRGDLMHLGRTFLAVRDARAHGATWTLEAGDLYTGPALADYQFSNLSAASITFSGGAATARTPRTTTQVIGGRSSAWRNIFGTDPDTLGQSLAIVRTRVQDTPRLQLNGRIARVRTWDVKEFTRTIDGSEEAGGGARFALTPSVQLVGDSAFVRYRATGTRTWKSDASYLAGAHVLLARGWVQVNASRFSPGELPVLNASLQDRQGLFAAAEYDVLPRVRLFGGWESIDTNINAAGTSLLRPRGEADRGFGGVRLRAGTRSLFSLRVEDGGRVSHPVVSPLAEARLSRTTSDTGVISAEWQSTVHGVTAFARYTRRENIDSAFATSTFTQHDSAGQVFATVSQRTQLFGVATLTTQHAKSGEGTTYLQISGGGQQQVFRQALWLRVEGTASRNRDLLSGLMAPRNALNVGLNGQITTHTTVGLNVYVDRAPMGLPSEGNGWLTRSTLRIVHNIPTGSVRVASATSVGARAARGTGSVLGSVFADWNGNGQPDPGEETLAGIPVALGSLSHVTTARDGQFAFLNVPAGTEHVRLDLNALPVDFDPPAASDVTVELLRGDTRRVAFGLLPLGAIRGRVIEDANRNGQLDPGEPPIDGAVLTLDGGQRSERVRKGAFRFDSVRSGDHRIELLRESLPEGSVIVGAAERPLAITRAQPQTELVYLVSIEKRPEVRKVFPPRGGGGAAPPGARSAPAAPAAKSTAAAKRPTITYTVQVAALTDAARARAMVEDLKALGFAAYLLPPSPGTPRDPYRVRVGQYSTRAAAGRVATRLEAQLGIKLWVTRGN